MSGRSDGRDGHDGHEELRSLAGAYAVDALDDSERRVFEAHLTGCAECRAEVAELVEGAGLLAEGAAVPPPTELRERVLAAATGQPQDEPVTGAAVVDLTERRSARRLALVAAAAVIVIAGAAAVALTARGGVGPSDVAAAPDAVALDLEGDPGRLEVVWSAEDDRVAVVGAGLADPGPGRVYELWFVLADGAVAPAGLFRPDDGSIEAVLDVDDRTATGWGVTIEPEGGSDQPTGDILYLASF